MKHGQSSTEAAANVRLESSASGRTSLDWRESLAIFAGVIVLAVVGYFLYAQFANYTYYSDRNVADILRAKLWTLVWLIGSVLVVYWRRKSSYAPLVAVLALSAYFVVFYAILFRGTEYGMNGHWGDNGNRLAEIAKMMAYNTFFTDWYLKDLPSFYPPLWFGIMAVYAKILGIHAYQTVKWGYLLVFLTYPWLLYFAWRKLVSRVAAAAVVIATIFFGYKYIDWIYYEHMTAALFLPWWIYYFERGVGDRGEPKTDWRFYAVGSVYGGLIFMTYYYWFFIAFAALPFTLVGRYLRNRSFADLGRDLLHKAILMTGVAVVGAVYWAPLLRRIHNYGMESAQNVWFGLRHANLTSQWQNVSLESILVFGGVFFAAYLWNRFGNAKIAYFFAGGLLVIILDRVMNLGQSSIQSRKVLEFVHVFAMAPLGLGVVAVWSELAGRRRVAYGVAGFICLASLVTANSHTEIQGGNFYKIAVGQRVPTRDLQAFDSAETANKVYLTSHYLECCYLPYYLFIPCNNMTSHTAGRYTQRKSFLKSATKVTEPELLAYAFAYNRYSPIDYVYLPIDKNSGNLQFTLYAAAYNRNASGDTLTFSVNPTTASDVFLKRGEQGIYELRPEARSAQTDSLIQSEYPDVYRHLQPRKW